jgi:hypothetical protein
MSGHILASIYSAAWRVAKLGLMEFALGDGEAAMPRGLAT